MSRFTKEWNGELGDYWAKEARREATRLMAQKDDIEVESDGAARWKKSGNYLPEDVVEKLIYGGADFLDPEATARKREKQDEEFLSSYRSKKHTLSAEMLSEMRSVFGTGIEGVDVLSGETYTL